MSTWSDPGYDAVIRLVRDRAGLVFSPARRASVENTIHRAMVRAGVRDAWYFARLLNSEVELRDSLIGELTIGESYFFRDPSQFELIETEIVPDLFARRPPDRPFRVWSAGCACGEEPYSLAILFDRMGLAGRCRILGTEICYARLEAARRAHYSRWSLRGVPAPMVAENFERHGRRYELAPRLRGAVEFRRLNLAENVYPAPEAGLAEMDLILCRNVLIYFDMETVAAVAARLLDSLADDGWLLLSASDPPLAELVPCTVVVTQSGIAYRRAGHAASLTRMPKRPHATRAGARQGSSKASVRPESDPFGSTVPGDGEATDSRLDVTFPDALPDGEVDTEWVSVQPDDTAAQCDAVRWNPRPDVGALDGAGAAREPGSIEAAVAAVVERVADGVEESTAADAWDVELHDAYRRGDYARAAELCAGAIECDDDVEAYWIAWVRALANEGRLEEAGRVCARGLDRHRLCSELVLLHAVLLAQAGRFAEAVAAARRALYLDRGLVMAHVLQGQLLSRVGERPAALHALSNATLLLSRLPEDAVIPASDGETAGRLLGRVRAHMQLLEGEN